MKQRSTTPVLKTTLKKLATISTVGMMVFALLLATISTTPSAYADEFDEKIKAIDSQVNGYQEETAKLSKRADSLQNAVSKLQSQQNTIQSQINLSQAKYDKLVFQIKETKQKIEKNQEVLSKTIGDLYVNGDVSPVEMLASSKNIGDFLDQQEYRAAITEQVEKAIVEIKALKKSLEAKREAVEKVIADQKSQKALLVEKQIERNNLLSETRGNEKTYRSLIKEKNSEIESLRDQQAAANAARFSQFGGSVSPGDPSHGGYPSVWANAPQDSLVDSWGMYNRECVSYTAWRVDQAYGNMPYWGGHGNANQWQGNAVAAGIPMGSTPKRGSVGVINNGSYGHAAWVESVSGNSVRVSQYNWGLNGEYSEMTVPAGFFDTYIYFGG